MVAHHSKNVCKPLVESFLPDNHKERNVYTQPLLARRCPVEGLLLGSHATGHLQSLSGLPGSSRSPASLMSDSAGLFGRKLTQYPLRFLARGVGPHGTLVRKRAWNVCPAAPATRNDSRIVGESRSMATPGSAQTSLSAGAANSMVMVVLLICVGSLTATSKKAPLA